MNWLIRLISAGLARRIENGSIVGAWAGAIGGMALGAGTAYLLTSREMIGRDYSVAAYLIFAIPLAIVGALAGAALGASRKAVDPRHGIRLTAYNRAAGALAVAAIFLALIVAGIVTWLTQRRTQPQPLTAKEVGVSILLAALFLVAAFVASRQVWYVDLGPLVRIRRLLGTRTYNRADLQIWGFEIRPNEVVQRPFTGRMNCCLQFEDGYICRLEVHGKDSAAVVSLLGVAAPVRAGGGPTTSNC